MEFLIKNVYSIIPPIGIVHLINYFYLVYLVLVWMSKPFPIISLDRTLSLYTWKYKLQTTNPQTNQIRQNF